MDKISVVNSASRAGLLAGTLAASLGLAWQAHAADLPESLLMLPMVQQGLVGIGQSGEYGHLKEVGRKIGKGVETENQIPIPLSKVDVFEPSSSREYIPKPGAIKGTANFEFMDTKSRRTFQYSVPNSKLSELSRMFSFAPDENLVDQSRPEDFEVKMENMGKKSWSNATDNRTRRAIADGFSDTNSIYQSIANYGGCTATVLAANWQRMVAITAAHCIYRADHSFSVAQIQPRANGGVSPTWGNWTVNLFGYYPAYLDNDCEQNWRGSDCTKHDIALIVATPDAGATPPRGMGWGYRPKGFLDSHLKFRRGYPGCGDGHSPSGCETNVLYGDRSLTVAHFAHPDHDDWNRQIRFSSDINPGDSGSGLYYYRDGRPYVFAVTSAEPGCKTTCTDSNPNYARRITPQWFDFINTVVAM